jgi:hypothetical protein
MTTSDEERLAELLKQRRELNGRDDDATRRLEREILDIIYRHLYDALRPQFVVRYGATVDGRNVTMQFTTLLNEFFGHVLAQSSDPVDELLTKQSLCGYVARSLTYLMRDHFRQAKRERSRDEDFLACLIQERRHQFELEFPGLDFADVTARLAEWSEADLRHQRMAVILQRQYISGADPEVIRRGLGISKTEFYRLRSEALQELRRHLEGPANGTRS